MPAYAARAGLRLLAGLAPADVAAYVAGLAAELAVRLRAASLDLVSPPGGPMVAVEVADPEGVAGRLRQRGVVVAPRGRVIRLSLHYYNNREDVVRAAEAVAGASG